MASVLELEWSRQDFPHRSWADAYVEVNGQIVVPQRVEFGNASTGQPCCSILFDDESRLNIWLDPEFPKNRALNYAIWKKSPFYGLTISTCPCWKEHKCSRCQVEVEVWQPLDQISVDIRFCERDDHSHMKATPHAYILVRNLGFRQERLRQ